MKLMLTAFVLLFPLISAAQEHKSLPPKIRSLTPEATRALQSVLTSEHGEYATYAVYSKVVASSGNVQPYFQLMHQSAERTVAVQKLFRNYLLTVTGNPFLTKLKAPVNLKQAAQVGIQLAEGNVTLYDKVLPDVLLYPDISREFRRLQAQTRDVDLPLLRKALQNGGVLPGKRIDNGKGGDQKHNM